MSPMYHRLRTHAPLDILTSELRGISCDQEL
jgi:hypothetical protein